MVGRLDERDASSPLHSGDATTRSEVRKTGNSTLEQVCILPACQPLSIRRAVAAVENVLLLLQLDLGKTRTARLVRDHRAAAQESSRVFVDEFNNLRGRGFRIHGLRIMNCPFVDEILVVPLAFRCLIGRGTCGYGT